jgi:cyclopropane-fatty-acyl-phospholipid synthase
MSSDQAQLIDAPVVMGEELRYGFWDRRALQVIARTLPFMKVVNEGRGELEFRDESSNLSVQVTLRHPGTLRRILLGGSLGAAEAYINGDWVCSNLTDLIRIFVRNHLTADQLDGWLSWAMNLGNRLIHGLRRNSLRNSQKNIAAHYDLGEDFFRLWLDPTLSYSSAIFPNAAATLEQASLHKLDTVYRKLNLGPADHLLEIGSGWGALAVRAAEQTGCRVTTTTISEDQFRVATQRAKNSSAAERINIVQSDYRMLEGRYDKLVSIEMIEAVGHQYFDDYFRKCGELLNDRGTFLMQAIIIPEKREAAYRKSVDFIQRYIFPGGCLPSLSALLTSASKAGDFRLVRVDDYTADYAATVAAWRVLFLARQNEIRQLGFDDEFMRTWNYYLCYCEALFAERYVSLLQIEWAKPHAHDQASQQSATTVGEGSQR